MRIERLGKGAVALARCPNVDQSIYEPLFKQMAEVMARPILDYSRQKKRFWPTKPIAIFFTAIAGIVLAELAYLAWLFLCLWLRWR